MIHFTLLTSMLIVIGGCTRDEVVAPHPVACTGPIQVSISPGMSPTIAWTPGCAAFFVLVEVDSTGSDRWSIITNSANAINPPVVYGVVPAGAEQLEPPAPLTPGVGYEVLVFRWTGPGKQDGELVGRSTFTR